MESNERYWIFGCIAVVILLFCVCTLCIGGMTVLGFFAEPTDPVLIFPDETPESPRGSTLETPEPLTVTTEPLPETATETLSALEAAEVPDSDLHELGIRFLGVPADTPRVSSNSSADYPIGTTRRFWVSNVDNDEQFEIDAELLYKTEHVYMWVEEGKQVDEDALRRAADLFEEQTYPTTREFFGSEWTPGVDGDPHLSILHAGNLGFTVAGYFSSPDSYVRAVREDSNEMEMFYINIDNVRVASDFYNGVLAHEFQHMIHWYNDRNEETWLNEGCSELAMALNERGSPGNYDVGGSDIAYLYSTDTQLTSWPEGTAGDASANYGGSYLFMSYFLDRFGDEATKALVAHEENGMESVDQVLQENLGLDLTHKDIFADWTISNLIDEPTVDTGQYGYKDIDPYSPQLDSSLEEDDYPLSRQSTVHQYGVDYIEINGEEPLSFSFTGSTQTQLIATDAHGGDYLWWSNRADESDTKLTRIVDLTGAGEAGVDFWTWYHIEEDWDYAYLVVGTTEAGTLPDDLASPEIEWTILDDNALDCTTTNPNGNSFGCGFTGSSNGWEQRSADLTSYTGQEIALRFEYITDAAVNQPGFAVDDVTITVDGEVLLEDDVEGGEGEWIAEGFVRHANVLPQEWIVQLVMVGAEPRVTRLLMADATSGEWEIPLGEEAQRAFIVISALAPVTTEVAPYNFTLR
ncbi:MAG: hypothetical protein ACLFU8_04370 [Anaerolineales bacterium]